MFVTGFAIAAGALSLANAYKKLSVRKKLPRFLSPESMTSPQHGLPQSSVAETQGALGNTKPEKATRLGENGPRRQLPTMTSRTPADTRGETDQVNADHYIATATAAMGLATAGAFIYPPLRLLSLPLVLYTALPLFQRSYNALCKEHRLKAVGLDSLAIVGALAARYYFLSALECCLYFMGQKLLHTMKDHSRTKLTDVFAELPRCVCLLRNGTEEQVPYTALGVGDVIVVHAGETVPVDGQITAGIASVDQRLLTGEAQPAEKGVGDRVFAATIVLTGRICIQVDKAGTDIVVAHIDDILNRAADFQGSQQTRAEEIADRAVLPTLGLSACALSMLGRVSAVAVLSANYLDTTRFASPLGMLNFLTLASQRGILIKDGRTLEVLNQVDTVVFDKTGTLTLQQPYVGQIYTCNGMRADELLTYAAAAETKQSHPIAHAIVQAAHERDLCVPALDEAHYEVGYGITIQVAGRCVRVGSARFMELEGITIPHDIRALQTSSHEQGHSLVCVAMNERLGGAIALHATIRPEAQRIIGSLRRRHLSTYIISGDHAQPTTKLAQALGIDHVFAETLPEDKARLIAQLQQEGRSVCFVGDGINDAIALQQANVSISLRGASTVATDTAQLILMDQSLNQLDHLFDVAQQFDTNMKITLATALIPGFLCVSGVFALHLGIFSASMLYTLSFVASVGNAMRPWLRGAWERLQDDPCRSTGFLSHLSKTSNRDNAVTIS